MNAPTASIETPVSRSPIRWFVMTFNEASFLMRWLTSINVERLTPADGDDSEIQRTEKSKNVVTSFYPYEFLRKRAVREGKTVNEDNGSFGFFKHIVFIRTTKGDAVRLVGSKDNLEFAIRMRFYLDTDGHPAVVQDGVMEQFINACIKHRGTFRVIPPVSGIEVMDKVRIEEGPFAGQEAAVTKVLRSRGRISLELSIPLVSGALTIRLDDVKRHQVAVLGRDSSENIRADFIDYTQRHLLSILANRVNRVRDRERCLHDADMLNRLYRYRSYEVDGEAAQSHFLALMLICAHLCKDTTGEQELKEQVLARLAAINSKSESRANTDTRTYLWVALYIATGDTEYSRMAKKYVQERQPKSRHLRRFVTLIRKGRKV